MRQRFLLLSYKHTNAHITCYIHLSIHGGNSFCPELHFRLMVMSVVYFRCRNLPLVDPSHFNGLVMALLLFCHLYIFLMQTDHNLYAMLVPQNKTARLRRLTT